MIVPDTFESFEQSFEKRQQELVRDIEVQRARESFLESIVYSQFSELTQVFGVDSGDQDPYEDVYSSTETLIHQLDRSDLDTLHEPETVNHPAVRLGWASLKLKGISYEGKQEFALAPKDYGQELIDDWRAIHQNRQQDYQQSA